MSRATRATAERQRGDTSENHNRAGGRHLGRRSDRRCAQALFGQALFGLAGFENMRGIVMSGSLRMPSDRHVGGICLGLLLALVPATATPAFSAGYKVIHNFT